jgi:hypothetical protein
MRTVVQLRSDPSLSCELVLGTPDGFVEGARGPIAVFGPEQIVGYVLASPTSSALVVFRTLAIDDKFAASVPGVFPRVRLLVLVRSAGRVRAAKRFFAYVRKRGIDASLLGDAFYLRANSALGGRRVHQTQLRGLLRRELERTTDGDRAAQGEGRFE